MKKEITTAFLTLMAACGFAQEPLLVPVAGENLVSLEVKPLSLTEKVAPSKSFGYLRMGVSDSALPKNSYQQMLPGLGLGYRFVSGASALDLSTSFNRREIRSEGIRERTYVYTFPKANYLYYISPAKNNSFYAGAGAAWGGVRTKDAREFMGLIPNVALGYEMNRNATLHSFIQFDISQPAIAASQRGNLPKPYAEMTLGAGF